MRLTSTDDAGETQLSLQLTEAVVTGYQAWGDATHPVEQVTFTAAAVEMSTATSFQVID